MARRRSVRSGFEQRFLAALRRAGIQNQEPLTVGFSGGADSLALSFALARVRPLLSIEILLVHIDHQLRAESEQAGQICKSIAEELGLNFRSSQLLTGLRDRAANIGLEEAARRERYCALALAAREWGSSTILLGHQANDQAETVLLHLFRGAGTKGLAGMAPREERSIPWWRSPEEVVGRFSIVRPLLNEGRPEIEAYLAEVGVFPIEDESNVSLGFDRNWIRHQVLPAILQRWPAAIESIDRMAEVVRIDAELMDGLATGQDSRAGGGDRTLCTDNFREMPLALARRVILRWLEVLDVDNVNFDVVARCYDLALSGNEARQIELGNSVSVVLADGCLMSLDDLMASTAQRLPMLGPIGQEQWEISIDSGSEPAGGRAEAPADAELEIRTVRRGDRWLGTSRSVFEDLRNAGIHPLLRGRVLAVVANSGVLLIPAIYPTIRTGSIEGPVQSVEVRWRRLVKQEQPNEKIEVSSGF